MMAGAISLGDMAYNRASALPYAASHERAVAQRSSL